MRTQDEFVAARKKEWDELQILLRPSRAMHSLAAPSISRLAALYRALCADLMRARAAGYDPELVAHLDDLAGRAHNTLYAAPPHRMSAVWTLFARDFPRAIRRRARFLAFSAALFLIPGVVGFAGAMASRAFAAEVLPEEQLAGMEQAYSKGFNDGRDPGVNAMMAGFYVNNNVGIAFRCFATGILFGLGSVFFLLYNGLVIGTVMGFVARAGHGYNIFTFCCGHSTFELTAIVISGAAGLQMGYALVATGGLTRFGSVRAQSKEIAHLILGAAGMLLIAAGIEGFWSPSSVPAHVKWAVAGALAILVTTYFLVAGRERTGRAA
ncbi:MAG TPA: stage II sporulation protein M [Polyangia bacterium]|nr:stage II sporulation protein M [Polyangia bacterium]